MLKILKAVNITHPSKCNIDLTCFPKVLFFGGNNIITVDVFGSAGNTIKNVYFICLCRVLSELESYGKPTNYGFSFLAKQC